jgi:hypothetical protein
MSGNQESSAWRSHFARVDTRLDKENSYHTYVSSKRAALLERDDLQSCVASVMDLLRTLNLDLSSFLYAISGPLPSFNNNQAYVHERTALLLHPDLPDIISMWRDSLAPMSKRRTQKNPLDTMALSFMKDIADGEMSALEPIGKLAASDLSHDQLLAIDYQQDQKDTLKLAPFLAELYMHVASTQRQRQENKRKKPHAMVTYQLHCSLARRSKSHGKIVKFMTMYMRSCHVPVKTYDTMNHLGITFSQKWVHTSVTQVVERNHASLCDDFEKYPAIGGHDNINKQSRAPEQRLDRHGSFDSGTAATVYIFKHPSVVAPSMEAWQAKRAVGREKPLKVNDILNMEDEAAPRVRALHLHHILDILTSAPAFDFDSYSRRDNKIFKRPTSLFQLPHGLEHRTLQYLLPTIFQECASYDGTVKILQFYLNYLIGRGAEPRKQLAIHRVLLWVGDQLSASRIRGVIHFNAGEFNSFHRYDFMQEGWGWLHDVMTIEGSLHKQFYGSETSYGLQHAFIQLSRKYLHTPSTKGTFHHAIEESYHHIYYACIRALWIEVADVSSLADLCYHSPKELLKLATTMLDKHMSDGALIEHDMKPMASHDHVRRNSIMMCRDLADYTLLVDAIQCGDVGTMKDLLPRQLFRFIGGGNQNYSREVAELLQCLLREWPSDMVCVTLCTSSLAC